MESTFDGQQIGSRTVKFTVDAEGRTVTMDFEGTDTLPAETHVLSEAEVKALLGALALKKWARPPVTVTPMERANAMVVCSELEDNQ